MRAAHPRSRTLTFTTLALLALGAARPARAAEGEAPPAAKAVEAVPAVPPAGATPQAAPPAPSPGEGVKHVVYFPESVKEQLRAEIREEVLKRAKEEGWAAPNASPEWTRRIRFSGDLRGRFEGDRFGEGNANGGEFPDFNAINTGKPVDMNFLEGNLANERYLNVDQDRLRPRLRARIGAAADVGQGFIAGLRLSSGDGASPVSQNQTLSGFSKYQVWIDRAFLRWGEVAPQKHGVAVTMGRMENPFLGAGLAWSENVSLDGLAAQARLKWGPFLSGGAFPVYTSGFAFPAEQMAKAPSRNKWLYAVQVGSDFRVGGWFRGMVGAAFYDFDRVEGRAASCDTHIKDVSCAGDESRPGFAQKGNTYMPVRIPSPAAVAAAVAAPGQVPEFQYFGLASRFREISVTARAQADVGKVLRATLEAEVVRNVGLSRARVEAVAINNKDRCDAATGVCPHFAGGGDAYLARLVVGSVGQAQRWDWNVSFSHRVVESDAVLDAFTDSDFGLGGTNLKGFVLGGAVALADAVWFNARWLSANAVVGFPYRSDVLQLDLSARF